MNNIMEFPRKVNVKAWENYLKRGLYSNEVDLILDTKAENEMNKRLRELWANSLQQNMHIAVLTDLDGNCLFNSLIYHGVGSSVRELRNILSYVMYHMRYDTDFLFDDTLDQLFTLEVTFGFSNDDGEPYVYNVVDGRLYKYTYDIMCQCLVMDGCWSILPANMILLVISRLFDLEIRIISTKSNNETDCTVISAYDNAPDDLKRPQRVITLGHIHENHYVPLGSNDVCLDMNLIDTPPKYTDDKKLFVKWARLMERRKKKSLHSL